MTKMDLSQERVESSQGREVRYLLVDPLDDSFRGWLQQRLRGSLSLGSMIWFEREKEAPSETTRMEEDQSTISHRAAETVRTYMEITAAEDLLDPGISCGRTSLVKREC